MYHVSKDQTLSSIMANQGIDHKIIYTASQKAKDIFKIDEIQSGVPYVVAKQTESPFNTKYLILNIVPGRSVVFEFENCECLEFLNYTHLEYPSIWVVHIMDKEKIFEISFSLKLLLRFLKLKEAPLSGTLPLYDIKTCAISYQT